MIKIPLASLSDSARENNIQSGIILFSIITFVIYLLTSWIYSGYLTFADLQFTIGAIIGVRFALINRNEKQSPLKYGIIVGVSGGALASVFISFYEWIIYSIVREFNIVVLFVYLGYVLIAGLVIGLIIGALTSVIISSKELKRLEDEENVDEDFFKDLIKD